MNRRNFLKSIGLYTAAISPVARIGGSLGLAGGTTAFANATGGYKALVILDMDGGNDTMNMFPPTKASTHSTYKKIRTSLGVNLKNLSKNKFYKKDEAGHFTGSLGANQPYFVEEGKHGTEVGKEAMYLNGYYDTKADLGIHGLMPEIASLYEKGVLSIVSNTGVLIEPTTKAQIDNGTANLPEFLFSHGNQRELIATLQAGQISSKSGWAGRLADTWNINGDLGLNISYGGSTKLFLGKKTSALTMRTLAPAQYSSEGTNVSKGKEHTMDKFEDLLQNVSENTQTTNIFDKFTNKRNKDTSILSRKLGIAWTKAPTFSSKNSYGDPLFKVYTGNGTTRKNLGIRTHHGLDKRIFEQLEATAKMIKVSKDEMSAQKQIFYVRQAGYDLHASQVDTHSKLLRAISLGVSDFYKALEEMGLEKDVLVISSSEFGRTMRNNGDGTDHGWGGHSFMVCGDPTFNGGQVLGKVMKDVSFEGKNAYTNRARMIPTTSIEQMMAPALKWFGVDDVTMNNVLPNLKNFKTAKNESGYLKGVFGETVSTAFA